MQVMQESESESEVAQSCLTLYNPMDSSLQGSAVHRIFQARILEWAAISFFRGSSQPRDRTQVSHILYQLSHKGSPLDELKVKSLSRVRLFAAP